MQNSITSGGGFGREAAVDLRNQSLTELQPISPSSVESDSTDFEALFPQQDMHVRRPVNFGDASVMCPLTNKVLVKPYIAPDGKTYSYEAIKSYLEKNNNRLPGGRKKVALSQLVVNRAVQNKLEALVSHGPVHDDSVYMQCPITLEHFQQPVVASDGNTYELNELLRALREKRESPLTREPIVNPLYRNTNLVPLKEGQRIIIELPDLRAPGREMRPVNAGNDVVRKVSKVVGTAVGCAVFLFVCWATGGAFPAAFLGMVNGAIVGYLAMGIVRALGNGLVWCVCGARNLYRDLRSEPEDEVQV